MIQRVHQTGTDSLLSNLISGEICVPDVLLEAAEA